MCNNIESTALFSSTVTGDTYKINHYFNCDSKCLFYLITCRTCKLNIQVRPVTLFGSNRPIAGVVLEKQRDVTNANKNICMKTFYKMIIMAF